MNAEVEILISNVLAAKEESEKAWIIRGEAEYAFKVAQEEHRQAHAKLASYKTELDEYIAGYKANRDNKSPWH